MPTPQPDEAYLVDALLDGADAENAHQRHAVLEQMHDAGQQDFGHLQLAAVDRGRVHRETGGSGAGPGQAQRLVVGGQQIHGSGVGQQVHAAAVGGLCGWGGGGRMVRVWRLVGDILWLCSEAYLERGYGGSNPPP